MIPPPAAGIIIPTHGRREELLRVLHALSRQTVPPSEFEVVVICDGDVDGTANACRTGSPELPFSLRILVQENAGPAAARNRGVQETRAPLVVFLDDDVIPDTGWLAAHVEAQAGEENLVTIGPLLPPTDTRLSVWADWEERALCRQYDAMLAGRFHATYRQFYTGNAAVRRRHLLAAGGFDARFQRAEDVELALRLAQRGLRFAFLPEARAQHYVTRSLTSWLRIPGAYGWADIAMARAGHPEILGQIAREFGRRHPWVGALSRLGADRPAMQSAAAFLLARLVAVLNHLPPNPLGYGLCALIFNLRYYDGVARSLGGRGAFEELLCGASPETLLERYPDATGKTLVEASSASRGSQ